jgi:hypothetical protein
MTIYFKSLAFGLLSLLCLDCNVKDVATQTNGSFIETAGPHTPATPKPWKS